MAGGRSYSRTQNPSTAAHSDCEPPSVPRMPFASSRVSLTPTPPDYVPMNDGSPFTSAITQSANNAGINNLAPHQVSSTRLTHDHLEVNSLVYCSDVAFCAHVSKAVDLQKAGLDLEIDLPLHCYMPDKSDFAQWIRQQAK